MNYLITPFYSSFRRSESLKIQNKRGIVVTGFPNWKTWIATQHKIFKTPCFVKKALERLMQKMSSFRPYLPSWQFFVLLMHIVCKPALSLLRINSLLISYLVSKQVRVNALPASCYFPFLEMCFLDRLRA